MHKQKRGKGKNPDSAKINPQKFIFQAVTIIDLSLFYCIVEEDNCDPNPCNSGTCVDKIGDYECVCPQGFSGRNCEKGKGVSIKSRLVQS